MASVDELLARAIEADLAERRALRDALAAIGDRLDVMEARLGSLESALTDGLRRLHGLLDALGRPGEPEGPADPVIDLADGAAESAGVAGVG